MTSLQIAALKQQLASSANVNQGAGKPPDNPPPLYSLQCICNRPIQDVLCRSCGFIFVGHVRKRCSDHPSEKLYYLMDTQFCPKCKSSNLLEMKPNDGQPKTESVRQRHLSDKPVSGAVPRTASAARRASTGTSVHRLETVFDQESLDSYVITASNAHVDQANVEVKSMPPFTGMRNLKIQMLNQNTPSEKARVVQTPSVESGLKPSLSDFKITVGGSGIRSVQEKIKAVKNAPKVVKPNMVDSEVQTEFNVQVVNEPVGQPAVPYMSSRHGVLHTQRVHSFSVGGDGDAESMLTKTVDITSTDVRSTVKTDQNQNLVFMKSSATSPTEIPKSTALASRLPATSKTDLPKSLMANIIESPGAQTSITSGLLRPSALSIVVSQINEQPSAFPSVSDEKSNEGVRNMYRYSPRKPMAESEEFNLLQMALKQSRSRSDELASPRFK